MDTSTQKRQGWSGEDPKKYQELLNEAKFEVDDQKKAELYLQAEELVVKSGLIEPTYVEEAPTFVKKYVKNYFVLQMVRLISLRFILKNSILTYRVN